MAKQKKAGSKSSSAALSAISVTDERKKEILGLIIIGIGVLLGFSILSYSGSDNSLLQEISLGNMFDRKEGPALRIENWVGPLGASLSKFFVYNAFGYWSIAIPILLLVYGWTVFRLKDISVLTWNAVYSLCMMVLLSVVFGWYKVSYGMETVAWSGSSGFAIADILYIILSYYGSLVILIVTLAISLLLLVDRDIQATIDRVKNWFGEKNSEIVGKREAWAEARQIKKEEEAQAQLEAAEQEAELQKETADSKEEAEADDSDEEKELSDIERIQQAERKEVAEAKKESSIDDIVEESKKREAERKAAENSENNSDHVGKRAVLDKSKSSKNAETDSSKDEEDADPEVNVIVGEEDEKASSRDLKKMQKTDADAIPTIKYQFPTIDLMDNPPEKEEDENRTEEINLKKKIILEKLAQHKIKIESIDATVGPTVTLYELTPAPDVKISKIESYANDLKMAMATHGLRIIAPIPGKAAVGIEVPNDNMETVFIKSMINTKKFVETDMTLPIAFGKTIENKVFMVDLAKMPHLLIAGATGSGKSVGMNTIITCLIYKCHPDTLKFVMVDPKKIELALYRNLERHFLATLPGEDEPIVTDTSKVLETLNSVCQEMDERYDLLKDAMVRDIKSYNKKFKTGELDKAEGHRFLPYIVVLIDELADLMMTAGKQVEEPIARIAQLARAVGIHMVIATQRPSVNVITGTIKANFPARVAYQVASKVDSRTILDTMGADQLVGRGDMLYSHGGPMIRVQNAFVSTEEVERITEFIGNQRGYNQPYHLPVVESEEEEQAGIIDRSERDVLFEEAAKTVVLHQQGSVSLLQRKLRLGYNRAGRIIDQLFAAGVVGPYQGSTARDVLVEDEEELKTILEELDED